MLTTQQYSYIGSLLAGNGQLVHRLGLHIFRYAVFSEACAFYAGCFAFENLHVVGVGVPTILNLAKQQIGWYLMLLGCRDPWVFRSSTSLPALPGPDS
jgi:hypothetical protein